MISRSGQLLDNGFYIEKGSVVTDCIRHKKFGKTLAFVLSACGYDVWLSNIRGNKYTTNHTDLDPESSEFWTFSLDQLSQIDLPEIINYVAMKTQKSKIGYIGYSMGTTLMFALMSTKPEISALIDPFIAIAPVVYISKIAEWFLRFKYLYPIFRAVPTSLMKFDLIRQILIEVFGGQELNVNSKDSFVEQMAARLLDQSSTLVLSHFLQLMAKNSFSHFDWGLINNYRHYGSLHPPTYPLYNITSKKIALIQTKDKDVFSDYEDLKRLKSELKIKPFIDYWVPDRNWTHSDYLFNEKTDRYMVSNVVKILKYAQNTKYLSSD